MLHPPQGSYPRMLLERKAGPSLDSSEALRSWGWPSLPPSQPSLLWLVRSLPKRLTMGLSHQRKLYFVPQRPNGASEKQLFIVSNKHFLGVINLYAKVTLGIGVATQIVLAWGWGLGGVLELEQAAVRLRPPISPSGTSVPLFLLLCDSVPSPTVGAPCAYQGLTSHSAATRRHVPLSFSDLTFKACRDLAVRQGFCLGSGAGRLGYSSRAFSQ